LGSICPPLSTGHSAAKLNAGNVEPELLAEMKPVGR
jgi:hypothetical protein